MAEGKRRRELFDLCCSTKVDSPESLSNLRQWLSENEPNSKRFREAASYKCSWNRTPLHEILTKRPPPLDVVEALVRHAPETLRMKNKGGRLPMHIACFFGASIDIVRVLVQEYPASVHAQDRSGKTPLHYAEQEKQPAPEVISLLRSVQQHNTVPPHHLLIAAANRQNPMPEVPQQLLNHHHCTIPPSLVFHPGLPTTSHISINRMMQEIPQIHSNYLVPISNNNNNNFHDRLQVQNHVTAKEEDICKEQTDNTDEVVENSSNANEEEPLEVTTSETLIMPTGSHQPTAESPTPENEWTTEILDMKYEMVQLNEKLSHVQTEIKTDIQEVNVEMTEMKAELAEMKTNMVEIKAHIAGVQSDVAEIKYMLRLYLRNGPM